MPTYKYTALDAGGQQLKGAVDAKNEFEAAAMVKATTGARVQKVTAAGLNLNIQLTDPKISEKALSLCCSQFAILLKAGCRWRGRWRWWPSSAPTRCSRRFSWG